MKCITTLSIFALGNLCLLPILVEAQACDNLCCAAVINGPGQPQPVLPCELASASGCHPNICCEWTPADIPRPGTCQSV
ncbi:hypothetical protein NMY22_g3505 [Coprinellus aureogranulatus]|nr:hypothetical protein NMY22_g3505 [Coprinellus aureogranulatus]